MFRQENGIRSKIMTLSFILLVSHLGRNTASPSTELKEFNIKIQDDSVFKLTKLRSIPNNVAQIITELPKFLDNENYHEDYKNVYLAIKDNQTFLEYDLVKSAIENALSILQKHQSSSSDVEIYQNMVTDLNNYYQAIITGTNQINIPVSTSCVMTLTAQIA